MQLLITIGTIAIAILPAFIWLLFFLREDVHPEPKKLISYAFFVGALSTIPALFTQLALKNIIEEKNTIFPFLMLALVEECFKFMAAYFAVAKRKEFDEPIDAMIYMIAAAAGFATIENVLVSIGGLSDFNSFANTTNILLLRFIGATFLHILASSIVGYFWAKSLAKSTHYGLLVKGFVMATLVHTTFNYLIATSSEHNLFYSSLILVVAAFFVLNDFEALKKVEEKIEEQQEIKSAA